MAFNEQENAVFIHEFSKNLPLPSEGGTPLPHAPPRSVASLPRFGPRWTNPGCTKYTVTGISSRKLMILIHTGLTPDLTNPIQVDPWPHHPMTFEATPSAPSISDSPSRILIHPGDPLSTLPFLIHRVGFWFTQATPLPPDPTHPGPWG